MYITSKNITKKSSLFYQIKELYSQLTDKINKWKRQNFKIIVGGDFNVNVDDQELGDLQVHLMDYLYN